VYAAPFDESALARRDDAVHEGGQSQGQSLGDDFRNGMD
jgi:hypothetical protein